jgi:hypothetical protein
MRTTAISMSAAMSLLCATTAQAQGVPARGQEQPAAAGVMVHVRSDSDTVRVIRIDGGRNEQVCPGFCDKRLPRDGVYQIGGDGITASKPFTVNGGPNELTLRVDPGWHYQGAIGAVSAGTAVVALAAGALYWAAATMGDIDNPPATNHATDAFFVGSMVTAGVLGGIGVLLLSMSSTQVTTSNGVSFSAVTPGSSRRKHPRCVLTPGGLLF